ncbi:MAG: hypothetical protein PVG39_11340 [Desulfobacteraceae bacterium]|jgi:hypothetical protein
MSEEKEWKTAVDTITDAAPKRTSPQFSQETPAEDEFNPDIHRTDKQGNPVRKKDGSYALKPGSGSPKAQAKKSQMGDPGQPGLNAPEAAPSPGAAEMGRFATETFFALNMQFFGKAAIPTDDTKLAMTHATSLYMESKGFDKDISPGVMLILVTSGYYAQVLKHQEPRGKVKKVGTWIARRFKRGTRVDSGTDGKREDDTQ